LPQTLGDFADEVLPRLGAHKPTSRLRFEMNKRALTEADSVPSVVALRRLRAVAVAKVTTVSGLAQGLNETFGNPSPFLELLIL
jgi:hypothetical protein